MRTESFEEILTKWSRVSEKRKKKKKDAEPEMGYCPFEHKAGRRRAGGALGAGVLGCWASGMARAPVGGAGRAELAGHGAVT